MLLVTVDSTTNVFDGNPDDWDGLDDEMSLADAVAELEYEGGGTLRIACGPFGGIGAALNVPVTVTGAAENVTLELNAASVISDITLTFSFITCHAGGAAATNITLANGSAVHLWGGNNSATDISGNGSVALAGGYNTAGQLNLSGDSGSVNLNLEGENCSARSIQLLGTGMSLRGSSGTLADVTATGGRVTVEGSLNELTGVSVHNENLIVNGDNNHVSGGRISADAVTQLRGASVTGNGNTIEGLVLVNAALGISGDGNDVIDLTASLTQGLANVLGIYGSDNEVAGLSVTAEKPNDADVRIGSPSDTSRNNVLRDSQLEKAEVFLNGYGAKLLNSRIEDGQARVGGGLYASHCEVQNNVILGAMNGYPALEDQGEYTLVGGSGGGLSNIIAGKGSGMGVALRYGSHHAQIVGNYIGTTDRGLTSSGGAYGVYARGWATEPNTVSDCTIRDNIISGNSQAGIWINVAKGCQILGNTIGLDANGNPLPNGDGIRLQGVDATNTAQATIGGADPASANVISGNTDSGIVITSNSKNNRIEGNYIGTDKTGIQARPNGWGIIVYTESNTIGSPGAGNIIAGNLRNGLALSSNGNLVQANCIGTNPAGDNLGNGWNGVEISGSGNTIGAPLGSTDTSQGNRIAFNGRQDEMRGNGVVVVGNNSNRNCIRLNAIFKNERLGIDLGNNYVDRFPGTYPMVTGPLAWPAGGPNNQMWHPTIVGVDPATGTIDWMLNAPADNGPYTIDVYSDSENGYLEYAEGETWVESPIPKTSPLVPYHYEFTTYVGTDRITATVTDKDGNTSEFSLADGDADGLCDTWETPTGIDLEGDGTAELFLPGANRRHKDVYVEVDSMAGCGPMDGVLAAVEQAFARVPANLAENPDGQMGITLHADRSDDGILLEDIFSGTANSGLWATDYWQAFHGVKDQFFGPPGMTEAEHKARLLVYRYCLFANTRGNPNTDPIAYFSSGEAEWFRANDFMVTLGSVSGEYPNPDDPSKKMQFYGFLDTTPDAERPQVQQGTFMHELGHTLGLSHVGPTRWMEVRDGEAGRGYRSVMNYDYQIPGAPGGFILDYSRINPSDWSTPLENERGMWFNFQESPAGAFGSDLAIRPAGSAMAHETTLPPVAATEVNLFTIADAPADAIAAGANVTLTFTVGNAALAAASASTFALTVPSGVAVISASTDMGTASVAGNTVSASFGEIGAAGAATLTLVVSASAPGSYDLTGHAATTATDPFLENNAATVTIDAVVPTDLGTIDFSELAGRAPGPYMLKPFRAGYFTIEAVGPDAGLALYDDHFTLLATHRLVGDRPRIDYEAPAAGDTYYLSLNGSQAVDLRLANLVARTGTTLNVFGTGVEDAFQFDAAAQRQITVNGISYPFTLAEVNSFSFDGLGGNDNMQVVGSAGSDNATLQPASSEFTGPGYSLATTRIESMDYDAGDGDDTAWVWGSKGANTYTARPGSAEMTGDGVSITAKADRIYGRGGGGADTATIWDSPGDDVFDVFPIWARAQGEGYFHNLQGFTTIIGKAERGAGGTDGAIFHGSLQGDWLKSTTITTRMLTLGAWRNAEGFDTITAYSRGGKDKPDTLLLQDTPGADTFKLKPLEVTLNTPQYGITAYGFVNVEATRVNVNATEDKVTLEGSPGDDTFVGNPASVQISSSNPAYSTKATGFPSVLAYSSGEGLDKAFFYDFNGAADQRANDDTFTAGSVTAELAGPGYRLWARFFDEVRAEAKLGRDVANLSGTATIEELRGTAAEVSLSGVNAKGTYANFARGFDEINALGGAGQDKAALTDAAVDLTTYGPPAGVPLEELAQVLWLNQFEKIELWKSVTGEKTEIDNIDVVFAWWE
ncbi:MAG: right-handed parallel beta-helix repeat-containing protein [Pirellulales bacterium]|nr:right-handed parallel beta-helix repeat-containing protein [Pirellulales bacterium]